MNRELFEFVRPGLRLQRLRAEQQVAEQAQTPAAGGIDQGVRGHIETAPRSGDAFNAWLREQVLGY